GLGAEGPASLDSCMEALWSDYGQPEPPVPGGGLEQAAAAISGLDLEAFFERHVRTTAAAPWAEFMAAFGVTARRQPAADDDTALVHGLLGVALDASGALLRVRHVYDDGPARRSGIAPEDRLVAFNGIDVGLDAAAHLRRLAPEAVLRVHVFRADALLVRDVRIGREHV